MWRAARKSSVGSKQPYSLHSAAGRLERVSKIEPESPQVGEERSPAAAARRPFAARGGGMEEERREGTFSLSRTPNQYRGCVCVCVCRGAGRRLPARLSASFSWPLCRGRSAGQGGFGGRLHFPVLCACIPVARSPAASPAPCMRSSAERACYVSSSAREKRACRHESLLALAVGGACVFGGHVRTQDARFFFSAERKVTGSRIQGQVRREAWSVMGRYRGWQSST